jgi:hypothetical protein
MSNSSDKARGPRFIQLGDIGANSGCCLIEAALQLGFLGVQFRLAKRCI